MSTTRERDRAIRTVDHACPHCNAARELDHRYCLECGRPLPDTSGRVPSLRRRWIRRFGWYPGDWMWLPLLLLLFAAAGAAVAVSVAHHRSSQRPRVITAIHSPPAAPSQKARLSGTRPAAGTWPAGRTGWTVVLGSYPHGPFQGSTGESVADAAAAQARKAKLPQVGVLDSSDWASLQPGYFVVFSGVYASESDAANAVGAAHGAGFGAAYTRLVSG